jgi:hypothetical protein
MGQLLISFGAVVVAFAVVFCALAAWGAKVIGTSTAARRIVRRALLGLAIAVGGLVTCAVLTSPFWGPPLAEYVRDVHPRNITRELAQWEDEFRQGRTNANHARGMLTYAEQYYRYEDDPEHRDTPVGQALAKQRLETLAAIREWMDRE